MTDRITEQVPADTSATAVGQRERDDAIISRIEKMIESRPALGALMGGLLEHLDRIEDEEVDGEVLLAMLEFSRKHPEIALILAILGRYE